jgi:hypothetical protein
MNHILYFSLIFLILKHMYRATLQRRNRASKLNFVPNHPHLRYTNFTRLSHPNTIKKCQVQEPRKFVFIKTEQLRLRSE